MGVYNRAAEISGERKIQEITKKSEKSESRELV